VTAGTYRVRIKKFEHGHSKTKGTPQITWQAEIIDGEFSGRTLWDNTIMVDNSVWRVSNLLASTGLVFTAGIDTDSQYFDDLCSASVGRTSYWLVSEKTLETGSIVNEVKDYRNDEDQEPFELEPEPDVTPSFVEE